MNTTTNDTIALNRMFATNEFTKAWHHYRHLRTIPVRERDDMTLYAIRIYRNRLANCAKLAGSTIFAMIPSAERELAERYPETSA